MDFETLNRALLGLIVVLIGLSVAQRLLRPKPVHAPEFDKDWCAAHSAHCAPDADLHEEFGCPPDGDMCDPCAHDFRREQGEPVKIRLRRVDPFTVSFDFDDKGLSEVQERLPNGDVVHYVRAGVTRECSIPECPTPTPRPQQPCDPCMEELGVGA